MGSLYDVLGVSHDANDEQIKKAYRKLSLQFHPDRNSDPNASGRFQEINEANEVLSDPRKRAEYDGQLNGVPMHDIGDILNSFFGQMGGMSGMGPMGSPFGMPMGHMPEIRIFHGSQNPFAQKPPPITRTMSMTLQQAYNGGGFPVEIERWDVVNNVKTMERMTTYISVPPGIDDNEMMILRDAGNSINGLKGDIKIGIKVVNDTAFKRNGLDLIYTKTITLKEALCGVEFDIQHLNGKILSLKNTANTVIISPNFQKVVPNYGMKRDNNTGNLIIVFDIAFPLTLTEEQVKTLNETL